MKKELAFGAEKRMTIGTGETQGGEKEAEP